MGISGFGDVYLYALDISYVDKFQFPMGISGFGDIESFFLRPKDVGFQFPMGISGFGDAASGAVAGETVRGFNSLWELAGLVTRRGRYVQGGERTVSIPYGN